MLHKVTRRLSGFQKRANRFSERLVDMKMIAALLVEGKYRGR
jgi:hypothetical protein